MTPFKQMNGNFYRAYSFVTFKVISALILSFPRPLRQYKNLPAQILHLHTTEMRCYRIPTAISAKSGYHSSKVKGTVLFTNRAPYCRKSILHLCSSAKSFYSLIAKKPIHIPSALNARHFAPHVYLPRIVCFEHKE